LAPLKSDKWWSYKIPPMLAMAYYALLSGVLPPLRDTIFLFVVFLIAAIGIAGFGHVFLDIFDVDEDRVRGQYNTWDGASRARRYLTITALLAASWIPWVFIPIGPLGIGLVAAEFVMFILYAVPPVRLKERGFSGIVVDSMYAHLLPALWTWIPFAHFSGAATPVWFGGMTAAWAFLVGMRELMYHQALDAKTDSGAHVQTFGARHGRHWVMRLLLNRLIPLEMVAFALFLGALSARVPLVAVGFVLYIPWSIWKVNRLWLQPVDVFGEAAVDDKVTIICRRILSPFYFVWMPLLLVTALAVRDSSYTVLLIIHVVIFRRVITQFVFHEGGDIAAVVQSFRARALLRPPVRLD
jgi:hypothetical protein